MASESVRALNEKIASDNLFKAKAVGETQVSASSERKVRTDQLSSRLRRTLSSALGVRRGNAPITRCKREVQTSR